MNKVRNSVSLNETLPRGGAIKRRKISEKLYVDFYYFGIRITKSTGLDDTPHNREKIRTFLDNSMQIDTAGHSTTTRSGKRSGIRR